MIGQRGTSRSKKRCPVSFSSTYEINHGTGTDFILSCSSPDEPAITVMKDGHHVSRISDFIIYSVEAEYISAVVKEYGPCKFFSRVQRFET